MGIEFDKYYLTVEQKNYLTKIVNVYIVYDLDGWPKNSTKNFNFWKLKLNFLFRVTSVVKIVIKKNEYITAMEKHLMKIFMEFHNYFLT